jgi:hypothetical protein
VFGHQTEISDLQKKERMCIAGRERVTDTSLMKWVESDYLLNYSSHSQESVLANSCLKQPKAIKPMNFQWEFTQTKIPRQK